MSTDRADEMPSAGATSAEMPSAVSLPAGFVARMERLLGSDYPAFLAAYDKPLRPSLRLNPLRNPTFPGEADPAPSLPYPAEPIPWAAGGYYYPADGSVRPGKHPYHEAGLYYIQEASAMIPASLCPPQPGERVLDLCAAPGGKATQLAGAMAGRGLLVANEIHAGRAAILSQNMERMGVRNALVTNQSPASLAKRFPGFFDRIVVDAPCSGEGMFRKEPQAAAMWSQENVVLCAARQDEILDCAAIMLRPGGYLTYSTCTFAPEENEGTLLRFLQRHPDFDTVKPENPLVLSCLASGLLDPGRPDFVAGGQAYASAIRRAVRLFPHHADGEGHFAVVLRKAPGGNGAADTAPVHCVPSGSGEKRSTGGRAGKGNRPPAKKASASQGMAEVLSLFSAFMDELTGTSSGWAHLMGQDWIPCLFGDALSLLPAGCGIGADSLTGLRVLRPGLCAGVVRGGRFEPSHGLAMALEPNRLSHVFPLDGVGTAEAYLHGDTRPCDASLRGWYLVTLDDLPLGWGKASGGTMKNHYPKGLRRP